MLFDQNSLKIQLENVEKSLKRDMSQIRTGRPSVEFFNELMVDYYGAQTAVAFMGQITFDSPMSITIKVFDKGASEIVKQALIESNIGATVNEPEKGLLKLNFQPLTEDLRKEKVKELGKILEDKKIRARQVRQQFMEDLKSLEKVPEDEQKRSEEAIQKAIDTCISNLQTLADQKSVELMSI